MEILLLRHGQTLGNKLNRYIGGRTDEPLSAEDFTLAREFAPRLDVLRVYVSPMLRAVQTAELLFPNAERVTVPGLREMDFGVFENRSAEDMEADAAYREWVDGSCRARCPEGESVDEFSARVLKAFDALVSEAAGRGEDSLYIVAHGGTLMAVLHGRAVSDRRYFDWFAKNCRGFAVTLNAEDWDETKKFKSWREASL